MAHKPTVLVLCTGNSCRSQMAEGLFRRLGGDRFNVLSAGTDPAAAVHPLAIQSMHEIGIDISQQRPKGVGEYLGKIAVRNLFIVCHEAEQRCPRTFPGMLSRTFWPLDDPAAFVGSPEATLEKFRSTRDELEQRVKEWLEANP
jgi:arsenate reductase